MNVISKFISWIKEFWRSAVIGKTTIKEKLHTEIAISAKMMTALELWSAMYENRAGWLTDEVVSTNLAAAVSSEIGRLVTIEMQVKIEGSKRADYLAEQFEKVHEHIREVVELGAAKGGIMLKPYVSGKNIAVDFIQADQFFPIAFDGNGNIISCVFVDQHVRGDKYYTRLEQHELKGTDYTVTNKAYKSDSRDVLGSEIQMTDFDLWVDIEPEATIKNIEKPLFGYFKYPMANNVDPASPLGVSCFSRAVKQIEQADVQWSDLIWEFESGRRALFVDVLAFGKDANGKPILPQKRLYRTIESGSAVGEFFQEWTPTLREANILKGFDAILKQIEFLCGLAYGTISDPNTVDKTATEIKTTKQRSYSTVVDTQKALTRALDDLLYAMDVWATLGKLAAKGKYTAVYEYDDSVIVDRSAQFTEDLRLVTSQIMSKVEFRMRNLKEDEVTAKKMLAMVTEEVTAQMEREQRQEEDSEIPQEE